MNSLVAELIEQQKSALVDVRRYLHQHPELSGNEFDTTRYLAKRLDAAGIMYSIGPENRGLVVDLGNQASQKRLALRADLDALSIHDSKNVEYRSQVDTVMHACGHDVHSSILLGTVLTLKRMFDQSTPEFAVRAIFQPEEETARGARRMIEAGVLEGVTAIVGAHVDPHREVGTIGIRHGVLTAHCDEVFVQICGRGGHAARPKETIDPVELSARFITQAYDLIPRYGDQDLIQVVLSFTMIHGGHQQNVIPDEVRIVGTMRSIDSKKRQRAIDLLNEVANRLSDESSAEVKVNFGVEVPSVIGEPETTRIVREICCAVIGEGSVQEILLPSMGGEDFAFYSHELPAAFIRLGSMGRQTGSYPLHNSNFDVDENVLALGANVMTHIALQFFDRVDQD